MLCSARSSIRIVLLCLFLLLSFPVYGAEADAKDDPSVTAQSLPPASGAADSSPEEPAGNQSGEREIQDDFRDLCEVNKYTVGWLRAGHSIDLPVLKYDNDFYLHHDFYGNDSERGTLFVNAWNSMWPRDWLLLIHGHHMSDGSMFGQLQAYEDFDYTCEHPVISFRTIYDEEDVFYVAVAAFNFSIINSNPEFFYVLEPLDFYIEESEKLQAETVDSNVEGIAASDEESTEELPGMESPAAKPAVEKPGADSPDPDKSPENGHCSATESAEDPQVSDQTDSGYGSTAEEQLSDRIRLRKEDYLDSLEERSLWQAPLSADPDDELLALVTCSYYYEGGRFLLVTRKLREDEDPEMVREMYRAAES